MLSKLSCALSGFSRAGSVFDALKTVKAAGFDGVDFPLSSYSRDPGAALGLEDGWRQWVAEVRACLDALQLPVLQAHAPWEQAIPADFSYVSPLPIYGRTLEACAMLGCGKLVFHPLHYPCRVASEALYRTIDDYNLRWLRELLPRAKALGIRIELENMFDYHRLQQPGDPIRPYSTAEQMLKLADSLGDVGICLDTGHANLTGQDVPQMIRAFGTRLECLHLNDNLGPSDASNTDLHLFPGEGTLDWPAIFRALREIGYTGVYNLELIADLARLDPEERVERLSGGRKELEGLLKNKIVGP